MLLINPKRRILDGGKLRKTIGLAQNTFRLRKFILAVVGSDAKISAVRKVIVASGYVMYSEIQWG